MTTVCIGKLCITFSTFNSSSSSHSKMVGFTRNSLKALGCYLLAFSSDLVKKTPYLFGPQLGYLVLNIIDNVYSAKFLFLK